MNKNTELQAKKDLIVKFFNENTHYVHYKVCKDLGISKRAIYVLRKTKHQAVTEPQLDKLLQFIKTQSQQTNEYINE